MDRSYEDALLQAVMEASNSANRPDMKPPSLNLPIMDAGRDPMGGLWWLLDRLQQPLFQGARSGADEFERQMHRLGNDVSDVPAAALMSLPGFARGAFEGLTDTGQHLEGADLTRGLGELLGGGPHAQGIEAGLGGGLGAISSLEDVIPGAALAGMLPMVGQVGRRAASRFGPEFGEVIDEDNMSQWSDLGVKPGGLSIGDRLGWLATDAQRTAGAAAEDALQYLSNRFLPKNLEQAPGVDEWPESLQEVYRQAEKSPYDQQGSIQRRLRREALQGKPFIPERPAYGVATDEAWETAQSLASTKSAKRVKRALHEQLKQAKQAEREGRITHEQFLKRKEVLQAQLAEATAEQGRGYRTASKYPKTKWKKRALEGAVEATGPRGINAADRVLRTGKRLGSTAKSIRQSDPFAGMRRGDQPDPGLLRQLGGHYAKQFEQTTGIPWQLGVAGAAMPALALPMVSYWYNELPEIMEADWLPKPTMPTRNDRPTGGPKPGVLEAFGALLFD